MRLRSVVGLLGALLALSSYAQTPELSVGAVTFWNTKNSELFLPLRILSSSMSLPLSYDAKTKRTKIGDVVVDPKSTRQLFDGSTLVSMSHLVAQGFEVIAYPEDPKTFTLVYQGGMTQVTIGEKWVEVNLRTQELRAYQGEQLVMSSRISSGRRGFATPTGNFKTGPYRSTMHYSSLYNNAPMPYSVQINGNVFIHAGAIPGYPASHGCVRLPQGGRNASRFFYNWVDNGIPVTVAYEWSDRVTDLIAREGSDQTGVAIMEARQQPASPPNRRARRT
ncbi:MAG: L,D-transpeptidase family protein [Fimbriimonadaceae bacterium]|jgi:hypothetical protein|nr:L,D-transpeptidase family protein [Fimbriimonadaceae bacterium]